MKFFKIVAIVATFMASIACLVAGQDAECVEPCLPCSWAANGCCCPVH
ncbi:hypothetical protein Ocin01_17340 [Orchesella cincta]|uniref:Uncharacterized protein n=1 Tax=Orchesella cincta TaxID=48709 RepID=A0A1D2M8T4_ORCCI|nr:hypothetical protein Ocin01_17340 [Orchesella cincta]